MRALLEAWDRLLASLVTDGGTILVLLGLLVIGVVSYRNGFPEGVNVVMTVLGVLLGRLTAPRQPPQ